MKPLAGADAYHVLEESPAQHMHTMKIAILDAGAAPQPITFEGIRDWAGRRLTRLPPLRWRLLPIPMGLSRPLWVEGGDLDLDYHVRRAHLGAPGGDAELDDLVSEVASTQLERGKPLWQLWFVDGLEQDRVALVFKIHHAVADGTASVRLFEAMFDHGEGSSSGGAPEPTVASPTVPERLAIALRLQRRQWARAAPRSLQAFAVRD